MNKHLLNNDLVKSLTLLLLISANYFTVYGSHVAGGYISYECTGNPNEYLVRMVLYRDCSGIALEDPIDDNGGTFSNVYLSWENSCGLNSPVNHSPTFGANRFRMNRVSVEEVSQICEEQLPNTSCNGGSLIGYEEHIYEGIAVLPPCDDWELSFELCCRNDATNVQNAEDDRFVISSTINTSVQNCNTSPQATAAPQPYVCVNQNVTYNLGATEPDGDNIVYSLDHARSTLTDLVNYQGGATAEQPIPGITIDQETGIINYTPTQQGNYIIVIIMEEFNEDGVLVSRTEYDFQTYVIACTNDPPEADPDGISNITGTVNVVSNNEVNLCFNESTCFDIIFTDDDPEDQLTVTSNFNEAFPSGSISYTGTNPVTATLCFDVGSEEISNNVTFLIQDDACPVFGQNNFTLIVNTIDCDDLPCSINMNTEIVDCRTQPTLAYDVEGSLTLNDPPATGQLIVQNCFGQQQAFDAPFSSPINFSFDDLPQTGEECEFTAYFTDDPSCEATSNLTAPSPITFFDVECTIGGGELEGTIEFENPPAGANLVISVSDGTNTIEDVIPMPATSPQNWSVSGLDPAASPYVIDYYFDNFPDCGQQTTINCGCAADAGTTTVEMSGDSQTDYELCFGDQITIDLNGDHEFPEDTGDLGGEPYAPEMLFLVYSCPPTPGIFPNDDPCFITIIDQTGSLTDENGASSILNQLGGEANLGTNTLYFTPITLYHYTPGGPFLINSNCWSIGPVTEVTYSPLLTANATGDELECGETGAEVIGSASGGTPPYLYDWDGTPQAEPNHAVNPEVTTEYDLTVIDANGCTDDASAIVTVSPPANVVAGDDIEVCEGEQVTLTASGSSTYEWDNNAPHNTPFDPPVGTTIYTVTGTDENGCQSTDELTVIVHPTPTINAGDDLAICIGENVTLTATGAEPNGVYEWDNDVTNGQAFQPTQTTTYTVTGTTSQGCESSDQVTVTVNELPNVNAGNDIEICEGESVTLSASGASSYQWDHPAVQNGVPFTPESTQTYTVTGTSGQNCTATDQVTVTVHPNPSINAGQDQEICQGESVTLTATGGVQYVWDNDINNGEEFTPNTTQTYTVVGVSDQGCVNMDQVVVTVHPNPTVSAGNDFLVCDGETAILTGAGANSYTWDNGVQNGIPFLPTETNTYTVIGTSIHGCTGTDEVDIIVSPIPEITIDGENLSGCAPLTPVLSNLTATPGTNCVWTFSNDVVLSGCQAINHTFETPGCYDVNLTVTTNEGCTNNQNVADYICVYPNPVADFYNEPINLSSLNSATSFENMSTGAVEYYWDFGTGADFSNEENPSFIFPNKVDNYTVTLTATSEHGCTDQISKIIPVKEDLIFYVPNAFTPDGDDYNETFFPVFTEGFDPMSYHLTIFNRWGEVLFESFDSNHGWNGTYGGKVVKEGTYIWKISFKKTDVDDREEHVGHVTLLK